MEMYVNDVNEDTFETEVLKSEKPVLVDFWASWCGPCKMMSPMITDIARELHEKIKVVKVDVDENDTLSNKYGIRSIPSLLLFKEGEIVGSIIGLSDKTKINTLINQIQIII